MPRLATISCLVLAPLAVLSAVPAAQAAPAHVRVPQAWAKAHHVGAGQGARDRDRDGLSGWGEYRAGTDPRRRDSDRDGVLDAFEDRDRDGLLNAEELAAGTDPRRRDSDRDAIADGREDRDRDGLRNVEERVSGHDLSRRDSDSDGVLDGRDNAGRVTAVSSVSVTIGLFAGGTLTASLSGDSWVVCSAAAPVATAGPGAAAQGTADVGGSTGSTGTGSGDTGDTGEDGDTGAATDPITDAGSDPETVEEDPAALASYATLSQAPEDGEDAAWGDTAAAGETAAPDLGSCAAALRVGAIVHKASTDGSTLTELELMKR